jgi:hypothetical protein
MDSMASVSSVGVPPASLMESAYLGPCRILGRHITRVTRGDSEVIICAEYCDGNCRLRQSAFEAAAAQDPSAALAAIGTRCIMLTA